MKTRTQSKITPSRGLGIFPLTIMGLCCLFFVMTGCTSAQPPKPASADTPPTIQQQPSVLTQKLAVASPVIEKPAPATRKSAPQKPKPQKKAPKLDQALLASIDSQWIPLILQLKEDLPNHPIEEYFADLPASSGKAMLQE